MRVFLHARVALAAALLVPLAVIGAGVALAGSSSAPAGDVVESPVSPVTVSVVPSAASVAPGGRVGFEVTLSNHTHQVLADVRMVVDARGAFGLTVGPTGGNAAASAPGLRLTGDPLAPGEVRVHRFDVHVPAWAEPGAVAQLGARLTAAGRSVPVVADAVSPSVVISGETLSR